ncbi:MAG: 2Fe-2S iron-sulfur cluster-binding protein [Gemmatimonadetes bacterium]|nr:2Fe-2S iron-sulfur cluster-binding protein [Gemmatimonadota bacterium]
MSAQPGPATDSVTCTINGVQISVPKGTRMIEAAEQLGIGIAHYCYHPGLSAPAMCRMCLVEVEGQAKLAPACVTTIGEGNVIHTESEKAREARRGTLEFYLINHPLDCPVCDKSGECKLQDFVHAEGRAHGRSIEPKRVFGQDDFGGDILYDGDRCIMCTRCVRFTREISQSDRLAVVQRGHRSVIDTFFREGVEGDPWAGNIVDICPVGALLSKDFLHKARAWDLDSTPSVCPGCSQGCNIRIDTRDNLVMRLRPRPNAEVNSYWMCDEGRYGYEWMNRTDRVEAPLVRTDDGLTASGWQPAMLRLVERLKSARGGQPSLVVGSPMLGIEDNGLLAALAGALGGGDRVYRSRRAADEVVCPGFPGLARRRDLVPNKRGLEFLGFSRLGDDEGAGGLPPVGGRVVIVLGDALDDLPPDWGRDAALVVALAHTLSPALKNADFVLPIATCAEQDGVFANHEGRLQRFRPALQAPPLARPGWQVLGVLLAGLDAGPAPADAAAAFSRAARESSALEGWTWAHIAPQGTPAGSVAAAAEAR